MVHRPRQQSGDPFCSRLFGHFPSSIGSPATAIAATPNLRVRDLLVASPSPSCRDSASKVSFSAAAGRGIPTHDIRSPSTTRPGTSLIYKAGRSPLPPLSPDRLRTSPQKLSSSSPSSTSRQTPARRHSSSNKDSRNGSPPSPARPFGHLNRTNPAISPPLPISLPSIRQQPPPRPHDSKRRLHAGAAGVQLRHFEANLIVEDEPEDLESRVRLERRPRASKGRPPRVPHGEI